MSVCACVESTKNDREIKIEIYYYHKSRKYEERRERKENGGKKKREVKMVTSGGGQIGLDHWTSQRALEPPKESLAASCSFRISDIFKC